MVTFWLRQNLSRGEGVKYDYMDCLNTIYDFSNNLLDYGFRMSWIMLTHTEKAYECIILLKLTALRVLNRLSSGTHQKRSL